MISHKRFLSHSYLSGNDALLLCQHLPKGQWHLIGRGQPQLLLRGREDVQRDGQTLVGLLVQRPVGGYVQTLPRVQGGDVPCRCFVAGEVDILQLLAVQINLNNF